MWEAKDLGYNFEGGTVVVTGGTGALGLAVVEAFFKAGATVYVSFIIAQEVEALKTRLGADAEKVNILECDLANAESVRNFVDMILQKSGRIDALVNVVGGYSGGPAIHETDERDFDFMMKLNLKTAFLISKIVLPHMIRKGHGKIVHVASRTGLRGEATVGPYSISKAGVIRLTETIADEVKEFGVNCNCIMPSVIDTEANRQAMRDADFSKWVKPEEIAKVILFLCSEDARVINGAAIPVYGQS